MNNIKTETLIVKNFNVKEGYKMSSYTKDIIFVEELVSANGCIIGKISLKFEFNTKTKILKILSNTHSILDDDVRVTYRYNNYKLRKIKIKNY